MAVREIHTDEQVDARLRRAARTSLSHDTRTIDTDEDLEAVRALVERVSARAPRRAVAARERRWLAVAAAVLVVGGVVAIALMSASSNDDSIAIRQPATTDTAPASHAPSTSVSVPASVVISPTRSVATMATAAPTTSRAGRATADPTRIETGGTVTITPFGTIDRACDFLVRTTRQDGPLSGEVGSFFTRYWSAGVPAPSTQLACTDVNPSISGPQDLEIPRNMPAGTYELCLTVEPDPAGCVMVTVTRPADEAVAEPAAVTVGDSLTITPSEVIARACNDIITAIPLANPVTTSGQLVDGSWVPAPGAITQVTYPACLGEVSDAAVQLSIPVDMPPGVYAMCLDEHASYDVQGAPAAACAVVTILPEPLPACWTEPVAPPTLTDGSEPGDLLINEIGYAVWGDPASPLAVWQMLGSEPSSSLLDDPAEGVVQISGGQVRAAVVNAGDWPGGPKVIVVRIDGCDRQYEVGPMPLEDAVALAQSWVDMRAATL
jgi:hypothetical protein